MAKEPIRVLHILQRMEAAGVQALLMNIYKNIDRSKVQFDFLVHYETPQFFDDEIEKMGGRIYRLSFREDYNIFKYYKDLNNFFRNHKEYKIVHGHMHSLGAIYLGIAKKYKIPTRIAHSHTNQTQKDFKRVLKLIMNRLYSKNATDLFACSEAAGKYMFKNRKFKVVNNAIDSKHFAFSEKNRKKTREALNIKDEMLIGCVGRFEIQKNQKFSIKIFKELKKIEPSAKLMFIGTGSMENEIKEMVSKEQLNNDVLFLGNRGDMPELYQAMDVFLFPSLFEGLGIVGVEAQAAGTPTVCTDSLPKEINVTPLLYRVSLDESPKVWAKKVIEAKNNILAHKNMSKYVKDANYDIAQLAEDIQNYYLSKSK